MLAFSRLSKGLELSTLCRRWQYLTVRFCLPRVGLDAFPPAQQLVPLKECYFLRYTIVSAGSLD